MATKNYDLLVIGGGMAGMTAAAFAAKQKLSVAIVEKSQSPGGRARSVTMKDYIFNEGPHALYVGGRASETLAELRVDWSGDPPPFKGSLAVVDGKLKMFPTDAMTILQTGALDIEGKWDIAKLFSGVLAIDETNLDTMKFSDWVRKTTGSGSARYFLYALARLLSYCHAPDEMSASVFVKQLKISLTGPGVRYLNGGWQTLVDGMQKLLEKLQVKIFLNQHVSEFKNDGTTYSATLSDGDVLQATHVVIAVDPKTASEFIDDKPTLEKLKKAVPVKAACFDAGLTGLPFPERTFALGISKPHYYSVHSMAADLCPPGKVNVLLLKYLKPDQDKPNGADEEELKNYMELIQPGWQPGHIVTRFLPFMTVTHWLVSASTGGFAGRPAVQPNPNQNIFLAGDWVGNEGILLDAAMASGKKAGVLAAASLAKVKQLAH
jgi:phytoene dehydrogenase-like protein